MLGWFGNERKTKPEHFALRKMALMQGLGERDPQTHSSDRGRHLMETGIGRKGIG